MRRDEIMAGGTSWFGLASGHGLSLLASFFWLGFLLERNQGIISILFHKHLVDDG